MEPSRQDDALRALAQRLQACSERLNKQRMMEEPLPASNVPVLGPLIALLRRLANRLATRWYVAPQVEQQSRFAQEITASFDELASLLVLYEQRLNQHEQRFIGHGQELRQTQEKVRLRAGASSSTQPDFDLLFSLPPEALYAWEQADLPPENQLNDQDPIYALSFDREGVLHFPLSWRTQGVGWHYLFNLAVLGTALNCCPGDLVLDFAGGSGWVSEFLNRVGMHTVLLDYSELQLNYVQERFAADERVGAYARLDLVAGDGMRLPFADESFEGIICMNSLHHMPSYEQTLREMARVLKPGRRAVFGEPGKKHAQELAAQIGARDYAELEKNVPLPLIYTYAMRVGFDRMQRYPYMYPEFMEFPYPEKDAATILKQMAVSLPDCLDSLSLFSLEKKGQRIPDSDLPPLTAWQHRLRAEITLVDHQEQVRAGEKWVERVRVKNIGDVLWVAAYRPLGGHVRLEVSLCRENRRLIQRDMQQVFLPGDLAPGKDVELEVPLQAPAEPGRYLLRYDMVSECRTSFEGAGSDILEHVLMVTPPEEASGSRPARVR